MEKLSEEDLKAWVDYFRLLIEIRNSLPPEVRAKMCTESEASEDRKQAV